jgi:hypothetical protein
MAKINFADRAAIQSLVAKDPSLKASVAKLDEALRDGVVTSKTLNDVLLPQLRSVLGSDGFEALAKEVGEAVRASEHDPRIDVSFAELARVGGTFALGNATPAPSTADVQMAFDALRSAMERVQQLESTFTNAGMHMPFDRLAPALVAAGDARDAVASTGALSKLQGEVLASYNASLNPLISEVVTVAKGAIDSYFNAARSRSLSTDAGSPQPMLTVIERFAPKEAGAYADKAKLVLESHKALGWRVPW